MSGSPLSFATIPGFETMCSPVCTKQEWRCVWRRAKNWKHPAFTLLIFPISHAEAGILSQGSEGTQTGGSKSCSKARSLGLLQTRRNPGRRLARGRAAVSDRYSMQTSQCKLLSSARSSPSRPPAAHKSFPLGRASRSSAIRFYVLA